MSIIDIILLAVMALCGIALVALCAAYVWFNFNDRD